MKEVVVMKNSASEPHISILGAGAAGLAAGYYAHKANLPLTIYEANQLRTRHFLLFKTTQFTIYNQDKNCVI